MEQHILSQLGISRDSVLWFWGKLLATVMALAGLAQMGQGGASILAHMGIPPSAQPYLLLAAFVIGIFSGHYGTSPLDSKDALDKQDLGSVGGNRGFVHLAIPVVIVLASLAVAGVLAIGRVHVPILNPHTKVQVAKLDRGAFETVRALQMEEERLFRNGSVPSLHAKQSDGRTLHQHIGEAEGRVYRLMGQVALTAEKLPTGGVLTAADLQFVLDLERAVADLVGLVRSAAGSSLNDAIDQVSSQVGAFVAQMKTNPTGGAQ